MKILKRMQLKLCRPALLFILLCFSAYIASASAPFPGGTNYPSYTPLNSWSFYNSNNFSADNGCLPMSFTNISTADLGNGPALVVNSPGNPAWLQFSITNATNSATNISVNAGSITFWYAPAWSSTNIGGTGPQIFSRLLEIGAYTPDSSFGWFSIYVDDVGANIYFSTQTNDFSSNVCTYVTAPISFGTNDWHYVALTYTSTNTAIYVDGALADTGPPMTNYPGPLALANGVFFGSDSNGLNQASGMLDEIYTYNVALDSNTIYSAYMENSFYYFANPLNRAQITSAGSNPSTNLMTPDAITGSGYLGTPTAAPNCVDGATTNSVWLTNVTAHVVAGGSMDITFTIEGGYPGIPYDVFANSVLGFGPNSLAWAWMGQGYQCETYTLTGMPTTACFLILGTPQDSDGADLTDAYQALVTHTAGNTNSVDGVLTGWEALLGLNPLTSNPTQPSLRTNYGYTGADWLNAVTGVKSGTVAPDSEGNVLSVSQ